MTEAKLQIDYIPDNVTDIFQSDVIATVITAGRINNQKITGIKRLEDCQESLLSAYLEGREPRKFAHGWAGVVACNIIVCSASETKITEEKVIKQELRTSHLEIIRIWSDSGEECSTGVSPRFKQRYNTACWYETNCTLERNNSGFNFFPSRYAAGPRR